MAPLGASALAHGGLTQDKESGRYLFHADGVEYGLLPEPVEGCGLLRIEGRTRGEEWLPLVSAAGMLFREAEGAVLPPSAAHARLALTELRHTARGRIVSLRYAEEVDGRSLRRNVDVRLCGRSLELRIQAPGGAAGEGYCGFALGRLGPEGARRVTVPGLPDPLLVLGEGAFLCAYPDRYTGRASDYPPGGAFYRSDSEGVSRPVDDTFYLTLSAEPLDPLPSLQRPTAPMRHALDGRILLDYFSDKQYAEDADLVRFLAEYGLRDLVLLFRNWQHFGYGRKGPMHYPADPSRGRNEAFRGLLAAAHDAGWLVALREEFAALDSGSPYWSEKALAYWWDGPPRESRRPGEIAVAGERMLDFARLEATQIERNYRPGAVFVDAHTAFNPETGLRQADSAPNSASSTEAHVIRHTEGLLAFLREVHGGPVLGAAGEGSARFDTFSEGMADAVLRGPDGGRHAPLIVDYELREVRPRLLGCGTGSYRQFCGGLPGEAVEASRLDTDQYRATQIALGHAGYIGNYGIQPGPRGAYLPGGGAAGILREYGLLHALQRLYLNAPVRSVGYFSGNEELPLAEALNRGLDLVHPRIRIEYGNGLTVWVNRTARETWPVTDGDRVYELPPGGFLALAPRHRLTVYSAARDGHRIDFCRSAEYTFLDVRGPQVRGLEEFSLDGSAMLWKSAVPGMQDLVLVGSRGLSSGEREYRLSERSDVRLLYLSPQELELVVMDSENDKPVNFSWLADGPGWSGSSFEVRERGEKGWEPSRCQVQQSRSGPQISRVRPGCRYRIAIPG